MTIYLLSQSWIQPFLKCSFYTKFPYKDHEFGPLYYGDYWINYAHPFLGQWVVLEKQLKRVLRREFEKLISC